jgi:hypothetical protein
MTPGVSSSAVEGFVMHIMGKVGVWLVVVVAIASTVLTAKFIQVRNSWTKKDVALQKAYQTLQPKIADLGEQVTRLEAELFRSKELWGQHLNGVVTTVQRQPEGILAIDRGTDQGLREKMTLYGFEILEDGSSVYRGDFTVTTARNAQAQLQPNWRVRPEDVATWQQNGKWRWRNLVPPGVQPNYDQQILGIAKASDTYAERQRKLATEVALGKAAEAQKNLREAELTGGDQLSKDPAVDVEYREGLVAAIEQTEEARNQVLLKVDDLRRKLRAAQQSVERLQTENLELARKLPQAPAAADQASK